MVTVVEEIKQLQDSLRDAIRRYLVHESVDQRNFAAKLGCTFPTLDTFLKGNRNWDLKMIGRALAVMDMRLLDLISVQPPIPTNPELARYQDRLRALHESVTPDLWNTVKQTIDTWCERADANKPVCDISPKTAVDVPRCPSCHHPDYVRPSRRRPWDWILAVLLLSPYRCTSCWGRFYRFNLGSGLGILVPGAWRRRGSRSSVPDHPGT
jgi:hypothetical protein